MGQKGDGVVTGFFAGFVVDGDILRATGERW
jgi:hypothetical protein